MRREIKIGIAFVVGMFLLFFGIRFLKGFNIFKPSNIYTVVFDDVTGLTVSSPVLLNGHKVGIVSALKVNPNNFKQIVVEVTMDKEVSITKGSVLNMEASMLGTSSLLLELNARTKEFASHSDTLQGVNKPGMLDAVQKDMLPQVTNMLPKMDSILVGLVAVANHPALVASLQNVNETTKNLQTATRELNTMMVQLNKQMPTITSNLSVSSGDISAMTKRMNQLEFEKTFAKMDSTMANVERMTRRFNERNNSMGLLLNERALYDSLNIAVGNMSALLEDVKKNPKKYINVKVF